MTITSRVQKLWQAVGRKAAAITAASLMAVSTVGGVGIAHADNQDWLRPDAHGTCEWEPVGYWVQRCQVFSPAMGRDIDVLIKPAARGGNAGLYLLDGMRADEHQTGWIMYANAPAIYDGSNITLVMPVGGAGSFYTDWDAPANFSSSQPLVFMWETFLTRELPDYLQAHFGVARNNNSIIGLSMGGTAAMNLAANHPDMFRQAMSYSGYLNTTAPGMRTLLRLALLETAGLNVNSMYSLIISPRRFANDPFWNMGNLRNTDVYVSASTGFWNTGDLHLPLWDRFVGWALEYLALTSTTAWEMKARAMGLNPTVDYPFTGVHNWGLWTDQLIRTKDRVLNVMNAW